MTGQRITQERWEQIKQVFYSVLQLEPGERTAYLDEACADDQSLREEVESLIASHEEAGSFINSSPVGEGAYLEDIAYLSTRVDEESLEGRHIGPYKVIREIGHGGMGVVYLAVRADDEYRKRVAIKLIKRGMDTNSILRRFRNERQILASLDHPNIARLLDGGTTQEGLPYFVMEYIEGKPIDEYCDDQKLTTEERLKVFRAVCSAIQFAHRNLVVHRDVKPSNILMTTDGIPKLLDFGIAKMLNPEPAVDTIEATATGRLMTPDYASPEQVRGEPITTVSDVYSLGVVLYELLTGHRPYRIKAAALPEIMRIVCESEPGKPSTAINRVEEVSTRDGAGRITLTPESVSKVRGGQPERLRRRLSGDIDNIVMKAMRKESQRRYSSVEQFSEDIRRHLEGLPVIACQDTFSYRAGKFIKRHKVGVAASALVVLILLVGVTGVLWQAHIATMQKARAEQRFNDVRELATSFLFEFHDAIEKLQGSTPARRLLVERALRYLDRLSLDQGNDLSLQVELANAYIKVGNVQGNPGNSNLGDLTGAMESYHKALTILEELSRTDQANAEIRELLGRCYLNIGSVAQELGDTPAAAENYRKALAIKEELFAIDPTDSKRRTDLASGYSNLGDLLAVTEDTAGGLEAHRKALAIYEELSSNDPANPDFRRSLALCYEHLGNVLKKTGNTNEGLEQYRKSLAVREALSSADPDNARLRRDLAISIATIGTLLAETGDETAGLNNLHKALIIFEQLSAIDPKNVRARIDLALTYKKVGDRLTNLGKPVDAIENYRKALTIREALLSVDSNNALARRAIMVLYNDLGDALGSPDFPNVGDKAGALSSYQKALSIAEDLAASDPSNTDSRKDLWLSYSKVGEMLALLGDNTNAFEKYHKALSMAEGLSSTDPTDAEARRDLGISHQHLAQILLKTGDIAGALENNRKALEIREAMSVADPTNVDLREDIALTYSDLGNTYKAMASKNNATGSERIKRWAEAKAWYQRSLEIWINLRDRLALTEIYTSQPEAATKAIAQCDAVIAKLKVQYQDNKSVK